MKEKHPYDKKFEKEKDKKDPVWWQPAILLFVKMSGWVAVPILAAIFIGQWLDDKWKTLALVGMAFFISIFGLVKVAKEEFENINKKDN